VSNFQIIELNRFRANPPTVSYVAVDQSLIQRMRRLKNRYEISNIRNSVWDGAVTERDVIVANLFQNGPAQNAEEIEQKAAKIAKGCGEAHRLNHGFCVLFAPKVTIHHNPYLISSC
jgi:hypothetical protein